MKRIFKKQFWRRTYALPVSLIVLLGIIVPTIWLSGNYIIAGHDTGFPILPIPHFFDRLFVWTQRLGLGQDQSYAIGGFFIHGFEALINAVLPSVSLTQIVVFAVWLIAPALGMLYLMHTLFGRRPFLNTFAAIFYMFNHYNLQAWLIAERTKFTLYAALPIVIAITIQVYEGRRGVLLGSLVVSLLMFFFNGGGFLPLYGGLIVALLGLTLFYLFLTFSILTLRRIASYLGLVGLFSLILNAFWILPYAQLTQSQFTTQLAEVGGKSGVLGWIGLISANASLLNLLRLQGIQEWYVNLQHPYAQVYLHNPIFVILGAIIPIVAFTSLYAVRRLNDQRYILLFAFMALLSMIFVGGNHPPLGFIYEWLIELVPGFVVFRTPFYKFGAILWLSYAVLLAYGTSALIQYGAKRWARRETRQIVASLLMVGAIVASLAYHYPFFTTKTFEYIKNRRTDRIVVPPYITDFGNWQNQSAPTGRLLLLPPTDKDTMADTYVWQYWSLAPLTSLLVNNYAVTNQVGNTQNEKLLVNELYDLLDTGKPTWQKIAYALGVDSIVLRKDFSIPQDNKQLSDLSKYEDIVRSLGVEQLARHFGLWSSYPMPNQVGGPLISIASGVTYIEAPLRTALTAFSLDQVTNDQPIFVSDRGGLTGVSQAENLGAITPIIADYVVYPTCYRCDLYDPEFSLDDPERILPSSFLFPFVKFGEQRQLKRADTLETREAYLHDLFAKRVNELKILVDNRDINRADLQKSINETYSVFTDLRNVTRQSTNNVFTDNDRYIKFYGYLLAAKPVIIDTARRYANAEDKANVDVFIKELNDEIDRLDAVTWKTNTDSEKRYILEIPADGGYDILLYRQSLAGNVRDGSRIEYIIDDERKSGSIREVNNDWVRLDIAQVSKGLHRFTLIDGTIYNQVSLPDTIHTSESIVASSPNSFTFRVVGKSQQCYAFPIDNVNRFNLYKVSFSYSLPQQERLLFSIGDSPADESTIYFQQGYKVLGDPFETSLTGVSTYQTFYSPLKSSMALTFCNQYRKNKSINDVVDFIVTDVSVERISQPIVAFYRETAQAQPTSAVSYEKINQTHYRIRFRNDAPVALTFSQSYQPGWQLFVADGDEAVARWHAFVDPIFFRLIGKEPLFQDSHMIMNGFSNGWIITPGEHTLDLVYTPQVAFYIGALVSLIGLSLGVMTLVIIRRRKR